MIIKPGTGKSTILPQSDISRILPRQLSTGSLRGTQTVGYGNTKIDGSNNVITIGDTILLDGGNNLISVGDSISISGANNAITVTNTDGSIIGLGLIPSTTEFGFFSLDSGGNLVMKIVNGTKYVYNPTDSYHNVTQDGLLPDGSGGFANAAPGYDVVDMFP